MAAHGGERGDLRIGNLLCFPFKAQGVANAMPVKTGIVTAPLRALDGGGDVDAHAKILFFDALDELLRGARVVKDRGARGGNGEAFEYGLEIRLHVALPVRQRTQVL